MTDSENEAVGLQAQQAWESQRQEAAFAPAFPVSTHAKWESVPDCPRPVEPVPQEGALKEGHWLNDKRKQGHLKAPCCP